MAVRIFLRCSLPLLELTSPTNFKELNLKPDSFLSSTGWGPAKPNIE
jgi:hypothetical protein